MRPAGGFDVQAGASGATEEVHDGERGFAPAAADPDQRGDVAGDQDHGELAIAAAAFAGELAHQVAGERAAELAHQVARERDGQRAASANQATTADLLSLSALGAGTPR